MPQAGTNLTAEQDLGFKGIENDGLAELMFRLRDRNRITADFLELDQSGTRALNRSIVFGDQIFSQGDVVSSSLQWRVMGLRYTYAFIQNDRFELAAGIGLHLMDLDVRGNDPIRFANYETSIAGILPTPVLESVWRVTQRISLTAARRVSARCAQRHLRQAGRFPRRRAVPRSCRISASAWVTRCWS